jgi:NAD-dependent dihydropyrimidine dehydrogenase PreA subunit
MKTMPKESEKGLDIFQLLTETGKKERRKTESELLAPLRIEEIFQEGSVIINKKTRQSVECKLCIKACSTNALFWRAGEVGVIEELCVLRSLRVELHSR